MYYPYFRGKQFELLAIRDTAALMAEMDFTPIIEPVRETLNGLERTLRSICDNRGKAIVIINPACGDHSTDGQGITDLLKNEFSEYEDISIGVLLDDSMSIENIDDLVHSNTSHEIIFIHAGFNQPEVLYERYGSDFSNIFILSHCSKSYRKHFRDSKRILIEDGFVKRRNADHPYSEFFSDIHLNFEDEDMDGFGDFLIVGDEYSESGGPAYAVAIHLTYINLKREDEMYIYHFVSTTRDTPTDPAGKFSQSLGKLIDTLDSGESMLLETSAIREFRRLNNQNHFPGLGTVKKLSMIHHIETVADFMDNDV
ncbi:sce7725 family protein [Morganella morganii subsp. morganii]|uniref:sce7725 family protein n=1 Tax=Morganella morganii TaxID=582 RepID=UPI001BDAA993|nr:sce7725 family protein [Morganella morganii]MBT0396613.1 sce7725 family protein [Morganella morganii subsp. morganii]